MGLRLSTGITELQRRMRCANPTTFPSFKPRFRPAPITSHFRDVLFFLPLRIKNQSATLSLHLSTQFSLNPPNPARVFCAKEIQAGTPATILPRRHWPTLLLQFRYLKTPHQAFHAQRRLSRLQAQLRYDRLRDSAILSATSLATIAHNQYHEDVILCFSHSSHPSLHPANRRPTTESSAVLLRGI